jgi:ElaB/YqjD/DUF883 family membrane-anchored ribosome-binding protein
MSLGILNPERSFTMANSSTKQNQRSDFGMEPQGSNISEQAKNTAENVKDKARQAGDYLRDKAGQAGDFARDKAEQATSSAGKGMENLASTIRDRGPQSGMLGRASSTVADTLDRTGRYLEDQGLGGMVEDLTSMVRSHPLPAVLLGIGLGFVLARMTSSRS